jgi:hypothetical protein
MLHGADPSENMAPDAPFRRARSAGLSVSQLANLLRTKTKLNYFRSMAER